MAAGNRRGLLKLNLAAEPGRYAISENTMSECRQPAPFDDAIDKSNGQVNLAILAAEMQLTPAELETILDSRKPDGRASRHSREILSTELLKLLNDLAQSLGEKRLAIYWLRTPQPQLSGDAPIDWLRAGGIDDVKSFADAFIRMQPD